MDLNEERAHLLGTLKYMKDEYPDFLLVAYSIYPNYLCQFIFQQSVWGVTPFLYYPDIY